MFKHILGRSNLLRTDTLMHSECNRYVTDARLKIAAVRPQPYQCMSDSFSPYANAEELASLGLDRLKSALMALGLKGLGKL